MKNNSKLIIYSYIFLAVVGFIFYSLTLRGVAGNIEPQEVLGKLDQATFPFELSPERGRYAHVAAMAEDNSYALSEPWADVVYPDVGFYDGKFYSFFAPGISYLALPFYKLGATMGLAQIFTFALVSIAAIWAMIFIFKIAREIFSLPIWASLFAPIVYAYGSTSWSYAITLYQHHLTAFFVTATFYSIWRFRQRQKYAFAWASFAWINYALAIFIDYPNAVLLLPLMVYFLISSINIFQVKDKITISFRWAGIIAFVFFMAITGLHFYHNATHFGSWKNLSGNIVSYKIIKEGNIDINSSGSTERIKELQRQKDESAFFLEKGIPFGFYTLLFSGDRGLLLYAPIFVLAFFGIFTTFRRSPTEKTFLLLVVAADLFLYSSWGDPWGGWAYGPRYLIPSMAILSIFAAEWLARVRFSILAKISALLLFAYSSAIALLGALTTNAVPPKIEGDFLGLEHNFLYNIYFFLDEKSGSFVYNTFFRGDLSLPSYFIAIYSLLLIIMCAILFILPHLEKKHAD